MWMGLYILSHIYITLTSRWHKFITSYDEILVQPENNCICTYIRRRVLERQWGPSAVTLVIKCSALS